MNYYIIPKNNFNIQIKLELTKDELLPFISHTLFFYMKDICNQLFLLQETYSEIFETINKIVNPLEFIHSNVPGSSISVSKIKPQSNIFYELLEIIQLFNITDSFNLKSELNIVSFTHNHESINYLLNISRENNLDNMFHYDFDYDTIIKQFINSQTISYDLMIFDFKTEDYCCSQRYIRNLILVTLLILKYQTNKGQCIIKIDSILYKAVIDVIYLLSNLFDKVYIFKPIISNVSKSDRYLICKDFNIQQKNYDKLITDLEDILTNIQDQENSVNIYSILDIDMPQLLINRLEESNIIIGQQQIESYDQIINIFKNKNREDKIENLKRIHIQKCIQWCEKYQLPHNKFIDKVNIFLKPKDKSEMI